MDPLFTTFLQFLGFWMALMVAVAILGPRLAQLIRQRMLRPAPIAVRVTRPDDRTLS
ncbi:hypothetical protein [Bordetella genomosp. 13]|uniref:hypothetical protein n=1 Tax=Bordetella genomosp. 13 TaxID=463040 RepID=UPI0012FBB20A|nr:hypothetical protein [Bordetella genomosp. 13]